MGKYIRKPKTTDVAVKDVSQSTLGVRTRATTLALQRLQSSAAADSSPPPPKSDFLELRSRRLEKPPILRQYLQNPRKTSRRGFVCREKENTEIGGEKEKPCSVSDVIIKAVGEVSGCVDRRIGGFEIEASLGENNLDLEARERSTRENTPCSLIRTADAITTPGSSTKQRSSMVANQMPHDALRDMPSALEMEDFFTQAEQPQQRRFIEKYNFDIVNDVPLPGRYEWVRVMP